jgi:hypothetical protein
MIAPPEAGLGRGRGWGLPHFELARAASGHAAAAPLSNVMN